MRIWHFPKPTIAQVQGACIAGSFMVANMCDLIVASDDAFFADPVVITLGAAAVEVLIHPWMMSIRRAKEMLYTGERMSAEEAHRIGMVSRLAPRAEVDAETLKLRIGPQADALLGQGFGRAETGGRKGPDRRAQRPGRGKLASVVWLTL